MESEISYRFWLKLTDLRRSSSAGGTLFICHHVTGVETGVSFDILQVLADFLE